eukprot:981092-Prorocentrum_minimum.AAC.2
MVRTPSPSYPCRRASQLSHRRAVASQAAPPGARRGIASSARIVWRQMRECCTAVDWLPYWLLCDTHLASLPMAFFRSAHAASSGHITTLYYIPPFTTSLRFPTSCAVASKVGE